jgi:hypothetical protein
MADTLCPLLEIANSRSEDPREVRHLEAGNIPRDC